MRFVWISCVGLMAPAACGPAARSTEWAGRMDTSASGRVTVTNPAQGIWELAGGWRVVEDLRIGGKEGTGPEVLGQISALAEDVGGRIWALESKEQAFKVFDRDGRFIRTVGREGGGPGEFRQVAGVAQTRDAHLLVVDFSGGRISLFDTAGTFLRGFPMSGGFAIIPWPGRIDTAGYLYNVALVPSVGRFKFTLVRYDSTMAPVDTLRPPRLPERDEFFFTNRDGSLRASVPFTPSLAWRLTPQGDFWFVLTGSYTLYRQTARGDTVRVVKKPFQPVPVTPAEKDSEVAHLSWFTTQGGTVDKGRIPDVKPAVRRLEVAEDGYLWVDPVLPDTALEGRVFEIFDPEGRFLGQVHLPFALLGYPRPLLRRDRIIGMTQDQDGVPYIVRARVQR